MDIFDSESNDTDSDVVNEDRVNELYSVLHYNVLSKEVPSDLLEKYDIRRNEDNEFVISFKKAIKPDDHQGSDEKTSSEKIFNSTNDETFQEEIISISDESSSDSESVVIVNEPAVDLICVSSSSSSSNEISSDSDMESDFILNIGSTPKESKIPPVIDDSEEEPVIVKWKQVVSPGSWTDRMKKYYNRPCEELKNFDFAKIREEIRGSGTWEISPADRFPPRRNSRRCFICRQTDHLSDNCPRRFAHCYMCGDPGHDFSNCPYTQCLNCGVIAGGFVEMCSRCEGVRYKTCRECGRVGHKSKFCPDMWRKYHSTTGGELVARQESLNQKLTCCNCAQIGHLFEHCPKSYFSVFPPTSCIVKQDDSVPLTSGTKRPSNSLEEEEEVYFDRTPKVQKLNHHQSASTPIDNNQASTSFRFTPKKRKTSRYFQNGSFGEHLVKRMNNSGRAFNKKNSSPLSSPNKKKRKKKKKPIFPNDTI